MRIIFLDDMLVMAKTLKQINLYDFQKALQVQLHC